MTAIWTLLLALSIHSQSVVGKKAPKQPKTSGFKIGKLPPGHFEYPELNALLTPSAAKSICDEDPECGGFSYRGSRGSYKEFDVRFFRFVSEETFRSLGDSHWHWTSYRTHRPFVVIPQSKAVITYNPDQGNVDDSVTKSVQDVVHNRTKEWKLEGKAYLYDVVASTAMKVDRVEIVQEKVREEREQLGRKVVVVSLGADGKTVADPSLDRLDRCCKRGSHSDDIEKLFANKNEIARRSCLEMDQREFNHEFAAAAVPLVLEDCAGAAVCAKDGFKMQDFVSGFDKNPEVVWEVRTHGDEDFQPKTSDALQSSLPTAVALRAKFPSFSQSKRKLFEGLLDVGGDQVLEPELQSLNQKLNFPPVGDEGTVEVLWGAKDQVVAVRKTRDLLLDAKLTVARGKMSVLLAPFDARSVGCDKKCSDSKNIESYASAVLASFDENKLTFDGKSMLTTTLDSGESLYVPSDYWAVAIMTEESVAVVESAAVDRNVEELALRLGPQEVTSMVKTLGVRDDLRGIHFRFSEILDQIKKASAKQKKKKKTP